MPIKTKEEKAKYMKEYYEKNKERIKKYRKEYHKKYYQENKEKLKEYARKYRKSPQGKEMLRKYFRKRRKKLKQKLIEKLGTNCAFCGKKLDFKENKFGRPKFVFHEIHGKPHTCRYGYVLKHIEDFVPLCWKCHRTIHWLGKNFDKKEIFLKYAEMIWKNKKEKLG